MRYFSIEFILILPKLEDPPDYNSDFDFSEQGKFMMELDSKVEKAIRAEGVQVMHEYSFYDGSLYKFVRTNGFEMDVKRQVTRALQKAGLWRDLRTAYDQENEIFAVIYELRMRPKQPGDDPIKAYVSTLQEYFDKEYADDRAQNQAD